MPFFCCVCSSHASASSLSGLRTGCGWRTDLNKILSSLIPWSPSSRLSDSGDRIGSETRLSILQTSRRSHVHLSITGPDHRLEDADICRLLFSEYTFDLLLVLFSDPPVYQAAAEPDRTFHWLPTASPDSHMQHTSSTRHLSSVTRVGES